MRADILGFVSVVSTVVGPGCGAGGGFVRPRRPDWPGTTAARAIRIAGISRSLRPLVTVMMRGILALNVRFLLSLTLRFRALGTNDKPQSKTL